MCMTPQIRSMAQGWDQESQERLQASKRLDQLASDLLPDLGPGLDPHRMKSFFKVPGSACDGCEKPYCEGGVDVKLKHCKICHRKYYCSKECQVRSRGRPSLANEDKEGMHGVIIASLSHHPLTMCTA